MALKIPETVNSALTATTVIYLAKLSSHVTRDSHMAVHDYESNIPVLTYSSMPNKYRILVVTMSLLHLR